MEAERRTGFRLPHWLMSVLCVIPMALAVLILSRVSDRGGNGLWLMLIICPLLHFVLMRRMLRGGGGCHSRDQERADAGSCHGSGEEGR